MEDTLRHFAEKDLISNIEAANQPTPPSTPHESTVVPSSAREREIWEYEYIDNKELGRRLALPESWIRDQVRTRADDPIPFVPFGKYVRFAWGSPELEAWIRRRMMMGCNRRTGRVQ
jgi:hypothetical protein